MKKKYLFGILFSIFAFIFTACNSPSNINVTFSQEQYPLSIGDSVDFSQEIDFAGVAAEDVVLSSSNSNVLDIDGFIANAVSSGNAYVLAKVNGNLVGQVKVNVRYKFSNPANIKVAENGVVSWDKSVALVDETIVAAKSYEVYYKLANDSEYKKVEPAVTENRFTLPATSGEYDIKVTALSHNTDEFDCSDTIEETVNYGAMGSLTGVVVANEKASTVATLSWNEKENALYDVYIEGFKVASDIETNSFAYDYQRYSNATTINMEIVAKPNATIQALETTTKISLRKPTTPVLTCNDGQISFAPSAYSTKYLVQGSDDLEIELDGQTETNLPELESGIYTIRVMTQGSQGDGLVLNSNFSQVMTIAKLPTPEFSVDMSENSAKVIFGQRAADENFKFSYGAISREIDYSVRQLDVPLAFLPAGTYTFTVQGVPTDDTVFTNESGTTGNILSSDTSSYTIHKLAKLGKITHTLNGTTSTITLAEYDIKATEFNLYINDNLVVEGQKDCTFEVEDLNLIPPTEDGEYKFKVTAVAKDENGKVISTTTSTDVETISILDLPQRAATQTNGYYGWTAVEGAKYLYQVFSADKDGVITSQDPVVEGETEGLITESALDVGYYKIKVYSLSTNTEKYLDAHFVDADNYFEDEFVVSAQIAAPEVKFIEDEGKYKLEITTTRFGGRYEVKVDGVVEGAYTLTEEIWNEENPGKVVYTLKNAFAASTDYQISVTAQAGNLYDGNINLPSEETLLTVTRTAQADYAVQIQKDDFGRIEKQLLVCQQKENVVDMQAARGNSELTLTFDETSKIYALDMNDTTSFGSSFEITLVNIAREAEENHYYLDSVAKTFKFARVETPTNVAYNSAMLTFDSTDANAANYLVILKTKEEISTGVYNYFYHAFEIAGKSINLQDKIEEVCASNIDFATAYAQMDNIFVSVMALQNALSADVHLLPSLESESVSIEDLSAVELTFDRDTQTLAWTGGVDGGKYDLYINSAATPAMTNLTNTSITLAEINGLDLASVQSITIVSKHAAYFDSKESNAIKVKQLDYARSATITKVGNDFVAVINIASDSAAVEKVIVDGSEISYTQGASTAQFVVATDGDKVVGLVAKAAEVDGVFYLDSAQRTFKMQSIGEIEAEISGGSIVWNNPFENVMQQASGNPYIFELTFADQSVTATYRTNDTEILINDIETLFSLDLDNTTEDFEITVKAVFDSSYTLNIQNDLAVGLYGESETEDAVVSNKLKGLTEITLEVSDSSDTDEVLKKLNGTVDVTFTDSWKSFSGVNFLVDIAGRKQITIPTNIPFVPGVYSLFSFGGKYRLSLKTELLTALEIPLTISVISEGNITSDSVQVTAKRFNRVGGVAVSPEGILTITDSQAGASYAVTLTLGSNVKTKTFAQSEIAAIDLTTNDWLGDLGAGDYVISVIAFDANNKILPSIAVYEYENHQFDGIKDVSVSKEGKIILTVAADNYTNAIFTIKTTAGEEVQKQFAPTLEPQEEGDDSTDYKYSISMVDAVALFQEEFDNAGQSIFKDHTFAFTVRGEDGINCPWQDITFGFGTDVCENENISTPTLKREDYDKDYIIFPVIDGVDTHSIRVKYEAANSYIKDGEEGADTFEEELFFYGTNDGDSLKAITGFWIEGDLGGRFSLTNDIVAANNEVGIACYALPLNEVLRDVTFGFYSMEVYRTGVDGTGKYIQYSPLTFSGYKLCTIFDGVTTGEHIALTITNGYMLQWEWNQEDLTDGAKRQTTFYVVVNDGINEKKFLTDVPVYDLRNCGLMLNTGYSVSVLALSSDTTVLASNMPTPQSAEQYNAPLMPVVIDGKLGFDYGATASQEGTFLGDLAAYFGGTSAQDYEQTLVEVVNYNDPFRFAPSSIETAIIRIKFTAVTESGAYGKSYTMTVPAITLMLDTLINKNIFIFGSTLSNGPQSIYALMYDYLRSGSASQLSMMFMGKMLLTPNGIGTNDLLFDDRGATIPKGTYEVSFVQVGRGNYIDSPSTSSTRVYLSPAPSAELGIETLGEKANQYTATVTPGKSATTTDGITFVETAALNYRMLLRGYLEGNKESEYAIDFEYDGSNWNGTFLGNDINSTSHSTVLYTLAQTNADGIKKFKVNVSLLRLAINEILESKGEEPVNVRHTFQVDIFALSNGAQGVLNGKSATFTLIYQDIIVDEIRLEDGKIILPSTAPGNLIVRYAYASNDQAVQVHTMGIGAGDNEIDLSCIEHGGNQLAFVSFSLQGTYTYNTMKVESDIYGIANSYKLSSPTITSRNNNLQIVYNAQDLASGVSGYMDGKITYVVTTDQNTEHKQTATTNQVDYTAGLVAGEINANEFYAYLLGNSGEFISIDKDNAYFIESEHYDHQLVLAEGGGVKVQDGQLFKVIFRSQNGIIKARMLDYGKNIAQRYSVEQGSIYFTIPLQDNIEAFDANGEAASKLYRVEINYYQNQDDPALASPIDSEILYFPESYVVGGRLAINGQIIDRTRDLASFNVSVVVAQKVDQVDANITTIDGEFFSTLGTFTYADGSEVLRTREFVPSAGGYAAKFAHPSAAQEPTGTEHILIEGGIIKFVVDLNQVPITLDEGGNNEFVPISETNVIVALNDIYGTQVYIDGQIKVNSEGLASFIAAPFGDDEVLALSKGKSFTLEVMIYGENKLLSLPLTLTDVYKLPDLEGRYEVKVDEVESDTGESIGYSTYIDFQKYFDLFNVLSNNTFYQIRVLATKETGVVETMVNAGNPRFTIDDSITQLEISVVDIQGKNVANRIKVLGSDTIIVQIKETEYLAKEEGQPIITWSADKIGFVWEGGEEGEEYEFFYKIKVASGNTTRQRSGIIKGNFYGPEDMGAVTEFLIQARNLAINEEQNGQKTIYIFSDSINADSTALGKGLNAYAGGNGTVANPYLIQTTLNTATGAVDKSAVEQFNSIYLRNDAGVYFKLMEDIEITLDGDFEPIELKANLIGNGKTIKIKSSASYALADGYTASNIAGKSYGFTEYSSLFSSIAQTASISNLNVEYDIAYSSLSGNGVMFAPLGAFNYGSVSNVNVKSVKVSSLGKTAEGTSRVFIAGVVAVNYGDIGGCINSSNFAYQLPQTLSVTFGYAGIALFNDSMEIDGTVHTGAIFNCKNTGDVSILISVAKTTIYASGIAIKNAGTIAACANHGAINTTTVIAAREGSYYVSGIAVSNVGGTISYCYNKAALSATGTNQISGIVVALVSGRIEGVVDTTGKTVAYTCGISATCEKCYVLFGTSLNSYVSSGTSYLSGTTSVEGAVDFGGENHSIKLSITSSGTSFIPTLTIA